jgi:hypothetical protein
LRGQQTIAEVFKGRGKGAQLAILDGIPGTTWAPGGKPVIALLFTFRKGKIATIEVVMDPNRLKKINMKLVNEEERRN